MYIGLVIIKPMKIQYQMLAYVICCDLSIDDLALSE